MELKTETEFIQVKDLVKGRKIAGPQGAIYTVLGIFKSEEFKEVIVKSRMEFGANPIHYRSFRNEESEVALAVTKVVVELNNHETAMIIRGISEAGIQNGHGDIGVLKRALIDAVNPTKGLGSVL